MAKQIYFSDQDCGDRYHVHRVTIRDWARKGKFPRPFKINGSTRWHIEDLQSWEQSQRRVEV